jgi:hypothetical protein
VEAVSYFNMLRAYPLTGTEIVQWAATIERVVLDLDPLALCWLVDEMLAGRYEFDKTVGIQQLITGLGRVEKIQTGYRLKTDFPG